MSLLFDDNDYSTNIKNFLRVIVIDRYNDCENTKNSINSVKNISMDIPITILTNNELTNDLGELNKIDVYYSEDILICLNQILQDKKEIFFCILNSGDLLLNSFYKLFSNNFHHNLNEIGAFIFDDMFLNTNKYNYKLGFSPDLYLEVDYIFNSLFINRKVVNSLGGFNPIFKNNFIRDIIFRMYYEGYEIIKKDYLSFKLLSNLQNHDLNEDKLFLKNYINNFNIDCELFEINRVIKPVYRTHNKMASIIIPFKDQAEITRKCIKSILDMTEYNNYEIILINNNSSEQKTFELINELNEFSKVKLFNYYGQFNWSKINNFGASKSKGDVLIFLNNDTEVISPIWLNLLIGDVIQEKTGIVGAKLFYPDNTIQHMGVVVGLESLASHLFVKCYENEIPNLYAYHRRNVSAVTGACLAIESRLFMEVNGFNENFEVSFSDVELCLRLLKLGYNNVLNPDVKLYHHEMKTRGKDFREIDRILGYHAFLDYFKNGDPFFNKNYSLNNSKILTFKKDGEIPGYEIYWKKWSKNREEYISYVEYMIQEHGFDSNIIEFNFSNSEFSKINSLTNKKEYEELKKKYESCNFLIKKISIPISILYLIFNSRCCEFLINVKLLIYFKRFNCFDVGYYLKYNKDLLNTIWFKYFLLEIHYICHGFKENRKCNEKFANGDSKKEILNCILNCIYS